MQFQETTNRYWQGLHNPRWRFLVSVGVAYSATLNVEQLRIALLVIAVAYATYTLYHTELGRQRRGIVVLGLLAFSLLAVGVFYLNQYIEASRRKPEVIVVFKDDPLFTAKRKERIVWQLDNFRRYLIEVGFTVPPEVPPIDTFSGITTGPGQGQYYDAHLPISQQNIDKPDEFLILLYSFYIFDRQVPYVDPGRVGPEHAMQMNARHIIAMYYAGSYFDKKASDYEPTTFDPWRDALWEVRERKGKEYMDKVMFFTVKRWTPWGRGYVGVDDSTLNSYLSGRILWGAHVLSAPPKELQDSLSRRGLIKQP